jgi:hypothetical protein
MWTVVNLGHYFTKWAANYVEIIVIYNKSELDASVQYLFEVNMQDESDAFRHYSLIPFSPNASYVLPMRFEFQ